MSTTLEKYRTAKTDYLKLRNEAKKELLARFNELAAELLQIQKELLEDFGQKVAVPTKAKKGRGVKPKAVRREMTPAPPADSAKVVSLQRQLDSQRKKLAALQQNGKPTKAVEDRIYELEDELKFARAEAKG